MARDAEGATKFVRVRVVGARTQAEARIAARAVANSQLVQCSLNGGDPYWGRVLSELGERCVPRSGGWSTSPTTASPCAATASCARRGRRLAAVMNGREIDLYCDLRLAHGEATVLTTDLSHAYIDENRRTS